MPSDKDDAVVKAANAKRKGGHRPTLTKGDTSRAAKRRRRNRRAYHEVVALATELDIALSPTDTVPNVIDKVFRRTHALWQYAATKVDSLDPDATPGKPNSLWVIRYDEQNNRIVEPSKWVMYENILRNELFEQAAMLQKLNIDEARVRIEAAQLAVLAQALKNAARKADLTDDQQRELGKHLRSELEVIEGTSEVFEAA